MTTSETFNVLEEIARLKKMTWTILQREGLEAGLTVKRIREARTLDEIRREILLARCATEKVEVPS